jgi:DNA polymerase
MENSPYDATPYVPETSELAALAGAAAGCEGCPLHRNAIQTVFGAGGPRARLVMVGEQPGDQEDKRGEPFVGPAGRLLDRALEEAGIAREDAYVTNAVKHFKFRQTSGKRRIHETPDRAEVRACRPWLEAELRLIDPSVVVALGATAAKAILGPAFRVTKERGVPLPCPPFDRLGAPAEGETTAHIVATLHPSAVLRAEDRDAVYAGVVADLKVAAALL